MNREKFWLQNNTWEEVEEYLKKEDIIIFPVGSTEQHGPPGPLGLDSYVAISLAEDTARETDVLVAPPLWFGDSSHHLGFAGTISLRTETLIEVTRDVIRSLASHGFKKIIVINGHKSSNLAALSTACRSLHQEELSQTVLSLVDPMYLAKGITHIKSTVEHHAGELETSQILYKYPHLIRKERLTEENVELKKIFSPFAKTDLMGKGGDSIEVFWNSDEQKKFAPTGSISASAGATAEKGKQYHEYMVNNLVQFIGWLRNNNSPIGQKSK